MRKSYYLTLIGIFAIITFVNTAYSDNFTQGSGNFDDNKINSVEYNFFFPRTPTDYEVITTYGKLPELKTEKQKQSWSNKLKELGKSLETELFFVNFYPNGKMITYGENSRGYFVVVFYKNLTVEKSLMDGIYILINEEAGRIGIQEIPVEFGNGDFPISEKSWVSEMEKELSYKAIFKREVIASYGKLPELKTEEQRWKWLNIDHGAIINSLGENFTEKYFIPAGPLVGIGTDPDGYIEVIIYKNLTVEKTRLDEIYGMIDKEAKKIGIYEVPVRFVLGDIVQPDLHVGESNKETPSTQEGPTKDMQKNKEPTPSNKELGKSVPSFGLLGGLITMFGGWLFRRKLD